MTSFTTATTQHQLTYKQTASTTLIAMLELPILLVWLLQEWMNGLSGWPELTTFSFVSKNPSGRNISSNICPPQWSLVWNDDKYPRAKPCGQSLWQDADACSPDISHAWFARLIGWYKETLIIDKVKSHIYPYSTCITESGNKDPKKSPVLHLKYGIPTFPCAIRMAYVENNTS